MQCRISIRRSRAWWLLQEPFLILGCSTLSLHHSWNNLVQNVVDIFCTLLRCDFPLPELLYAIYQLLLVAWLDFRFQVELEFMPQVFDWVEVRTLWRSTPPVNVFLLKEGLCSPGCVFGIVVLHELVVGKFVSDKWHERGLKYIAEEISIHDAIKDTNLSGTMAANPPPPPDMNFERVLRFRLSLGGLIRHPEACTATRLERNRALIAKNHVVESVSNPQNTLCELQPLHFVRIPNQLAIGGPLQSPALLFSRSSYRGQTHANSTFCQLLLDLGTGHLVILADLLIYEGSCFDRQFSWSPRAR